MDDVTFVVSVAYEGGLEAWGLHDSIHMQADDWDSLCVQVVDAVHSQCGDEAFPRRIRMLPRQL